MYINTQTLSQVSEAEIRALNPNTSFPEPFYPPEEYAHIFQTPKPEHSAVTQIVRETAPVLTSKGHSCTLR